MDLLLIVIGFLAVIAIVVGVAALPAFVTWELWVHVVPALFPGTSPALAHPSFLVFWGAFVLLGMLARSFRSKD